MRNSLQSTFFDREHAANYDQNFAKLAPIPNALQLLMSTPFAELPADAHIVCVGVGTGTELLDLAEQHPHWRFTAVEPAAAMLDICRQRVEQRGFTARCTFHEGTLDSLDAPQDFHAATCLLVSHFMTEPDAQRDFFSQIARRLRPGGLLVNAALTAATSPATQQQLFDWWIKITGLNERSSEQIKNMRAAFDHSIALLSPEAMENLLESSGFESPVLFYQAVMIRAWLARRAA